MFGTFQNRIQGASTPNFYELQECILIFLHERTNLKALLSLHGGASPGFNIQEGVVKLGNGLGNPRDPSTTIQ